MLFRVCSYPKAFPYLRQEVLLSSATQQNNAFVFIRMVEQLFLASSERAMLMLGKIRLSAKCRSSTTSMFPVPLNSSKITSSIREPVSIKAVAIIVREPPSSTLRAAQRSAWVYAMHLRPHHQKEFSRSEVVRYYRHGPGE